MVAAMLYPALNNAPADGSLELPRALVWCQSANSQTHPL